ncbi:hypothetical protein KZZ52_23360 [Dactylosporangium sp. AC04546]|uniref:hypothetical protein n=1 Tax=Dactylosporangium sp. AC04546 TaxID=2862460 RepID=UPI001EE09FF3|nr:hypothetical protein [Dactylosporangium sp. AC04546]WVK88216.1 hypothetical protein KZZ52_23360 [Dactylosporangium sp. AC04546]
MPKLACRCGYIHNLSPIPDDGFQVLPDWATDKLLYADATTEEWEARQLREAALSRLYSCPNCEAIMWDKAGDGHFRTFVPCERMIRIFADLADRDELGGIRLRHPRTMADVERQHLLLRHGGYVVVHDGHDEVYTCLNEPRDENGEPVDGTWIAHPLDDSDVARIRAWDR